MSHRFAPTADHDTIRCVDCDALRGTTEPCPALGGITPHAAVPRPGTAPPRWPAGGGRVDARCNVCYQPIHAADITADWTHTKMRDGEPLSLGHLVLSGDVDAELLMRDEPDYDLGDNF